MIIRCRKFLVVLGLWIVGASGCSSSDDESTEVVETQDEAADVEGGKDAPPPADTAAAPAEKAPEVAPVVEPAPAPVIATEPVPPPAPVVAPTPIVETSNPVAAMDAALSNQDASGMGEEAAPKKHRKKKRHHAARHNMAEEVTFAAGGVAYVVRPGDTLASIATQVYGMTSKWKDIAGHNRVSNPRKLFPGRVLMLPAAEETQYGISMRDLPTLSHTVTRGQSLSQIAKSNLGFSDAWKFIYFENRSAIKNPNLIFVGQTLTFRDFRRQGQDNSGTGVASTAPEAVEEAAPMETTTAAPQQTEQATTEPPVPPTMPTSATEGTPPEEGQQEGAH